MTSWWNNNAEAEIDAFKEWTKDYNHPTKIYCRKYVANKGYESIIDCGCGLATEFHGYKADNYPIKYAGMDSCKYFVNTNRASGVPMIESELDGPLPIRDSLYDCVYCREVIEHLPYYENAINEFIRIGKREVLIVWFLAPRPEPDNMNYWPSGDLYHNIYDSRKLEFFLMNNPKVDYFTWETIRLRGHENPNETILHIFLKPDLT